jgi:heme-degrading monooxygenase HmoA
MIMRIWHGWTSAQNAEAYEKLLRAEIFAGIEAREIQGYRGIELLRRDVAGEVEFVTVMRFDSLDAVRSFAGEDYEVAVVPPTARRLLARFDTRSAHYQLVESRAPALTSGRA